jgi:hypothetical protein
MRNGNFEQQMTDDKMANEQQRQQRQWKRQWQRATTTTKVMGDSCLIHVEESISESEGLTPSNT